MQAAHGPGHRDGPGGVRDHHVVGIEVAQHVIEGLQLLAGLGPADHDGPAEPVGVERVQRLAQLEHQVVGDVHGQGHAAQASPGQPDPHAQRRGRGRVEAAHLAEHEPVARGGIPDAGRVDLAGHRGEVGGQVSLGRVGKTHPVGRGQFPGHAADRERVAPVRGDRDVEHVVVEPGVRHEVPAQRGVRRQHQDAGMIVTEAELGGGADHPLRDVPVGLPGADLEPAGQPGPGQGQRHPVPGAEVDRPADDPARLAAAGVHLAVPDGLLEAGEFLDPGDLGDHDALDVVPDLLDRLDLQARRGEAAGHLRRIGTRIHASRLEQPVQ